MFPFQIYIRVIFLVLLIILRLITWFIHLVQVVYHLILEFSFLLLIRILLFSLTHPSIEIIFYLFYFLAYLVHRLFISIFRLVFYFLFVFSSFLFSIRHPLFYVVLDFLLVFRLIDLLVWWCLDSDWIPLLHFLYLLMALHLHQLLGILVNASFLQAFYYSHDIL